MEMKLGFDAIMVDRAYIYIDAPVTNVTGQDLCGTVPNNGDTHHQMNSKAFLNQTGDGVFVGIPL